MMEMMGSGTVQCRTSDEVIDDGNDGVWNISM
jgi:hypothetical protein